MITEMKPPHLQTAPKNDQTHRENPCGPDSGRERRKASMWNKVRRFSVTVLDRLADWLFDNDLDTLEKYLLTCRFAMSFAVLALSSRIIAVPPPYWQVYALTLPAWLWSALIFTGAVWQLRGRLRRCFCTRRNGSAFSVFILFLLIGPLMLRGPGLATITLVAMLYESTITVRFYKLCMGCEPEE